MKIPINVPIIGKEEINEVRAVLEENSLTSAANSGGKRVQEFERLLSSFVKSKYAVAVNSGTAALQAALYALDIKQGDEVLIPSFTFVATANSVVSVGAKPVFVDILKENYTIDPDDLRKKITKKSKAVIPVHMYGNMAYMKELSDIANKYNLEIIEDAAQSLGTTYKGKHSGTFSKLGCFSLYAAKVMTSGEGGAIVTDNKNLYEKLRKIRNHGMLHGYDTRILGLNLRLPEINAAIAKIQMKKIGKFLQQRQKNARILTELLSDLDDIIIPHERKGEKVNWYLFTIATKNRNKIMKKLNSEGIGAAAYYPIPVHKTPFYNTKQNLAVTDWAASSVLSLPVHPLVSKQNLVHISKVMHKAVTT
ncbi:MAG TPA: DegT/DnrJ/EryC1/StrS family aminotransferase [Nitrosopumilaceae archaeon]|nr:DegT/DnrJ/EryC1/StrS family aminotransferase [Nitrosopumilaceae archaeon]